MSRDTLAHLQLYLRLGLTPIPLKPCSKEPLVKWGNGYNPSDEDLEQWATQPDFNWGIRCGEELDDSGDGLRLLQEHLGHASFNTTANYRKIAGEEHKRWYEKLWERKGV